MRSWATQVGAAAAAAVAISWFLMTPSAIFCKHVWNAARSLVSFLFASLASVFWQLFKLIDVVRISELDLKPQEVLESPAWNALKPYVTPVLRTDAGRANPFAAP